MKPPQPPRLKSLPLPADSEAAERFVRAAEDEPPKTAPEKPKKPSKSRKQAKKPSAPSRPKPEIPMIDLSSPTIQVTYRIPSDLVERLRDLSSHTRVSATQIVVKALHEKVEELLRKYEKEAGQPLPRRLEMDI